MKLCLQLSSEEWVPRAGRFFHWGFATSTTCDKLCLHPARRCCNLLQAQLLPHFGFKEANSVKHSARKVGFHLERRKKIENKKKEEKEDKYASEQAFECSPLLTYTVTRPEYDKLPIKSIPNKNFNRTFLSHRAIQASQLFLFYFSTVVFIFTRNWMPRCLILPLGYQKVAFILWERLFDKLGPFSLLIRVT